MKKLDKDSWRAICGAIAAILAAIGAAFGFNSCGITRATISKPAEGTQTTITITTNNPISTNIDPTINAEYKPQKGE